MPRYKLVGRVDTSNHTAIRATLETALPRGTVKDEGDHFSVEAVLQGSSAKDLNRSLLSALRRKEKRTRLRAEWTSEEGTTERYFDYVLKKTMRSSAQEKRQ